VPVRREKIVLAARDRWTKAPRINLIGHRGGYIISGPSRLGVVLGPGRRFNCRRLGHSPPGKKAVKGCRWAGK